MKLFPSGVIQIPLISTESRKFPSVDITTWSRIEISQNTRKSWLKNIIYIKSPVFIQVWHFVSMQCRAFDDVFCPLDVNKYWVKIPSAVQQCKRDEEDTLAYVDACVCLQNRFKVPHWNPPEVHMRSTRRFNAASHTQVIITIIMTCPLLDDGDDRH